MLPHIRAQIELSSTFVYDYKMSTSGSSAKNSHLSQGGRTTMMPMPVNRITSQCKIKLSQKYFPWINLQLWNSCHSFVQWMGNFFLDCYVLLCNTCLYRSVRRHVHHCHSSPLAEVRIPRRTAARAHFLVINKSAGQFYLNFDTRYLTIPIPFSWIGSNVQQEKLLKIHCNISKCSQLNFEWVLVTDFCSNDFSKIFPAYLLHQ